MKKEFIKPYTDNRIIGVIYETDIQSFAKGNFGRELTDTELNRVSQATLDDEATMYNLFAVYYSAIKCALDENEDWSFIDNMFISQKH